MILILLFVLSFSAILCKPLLPKQSVIPLFDNSKNKPAYPTSIASHGRAVDVVEEWDFITPPPYKVVGTVIHSSNSFRETERKVIASMKGNGIIRSGSSNTGSEKLYVHEAAEELEESHDLSSSKQRDDTSDDSGTIMLNFETSTGNDVTKCNNTSTCHYVSTTYPTVAPVSTNSSALTPMNDSARNVNDKSHTERTDPQSQVIDMEEILNAFATFLTPPISSEVNSADGQPLPAVNVTYGNAEIELFDEDNTGSVASIAEKKISDKIFSQIDGKNEMGRSDVKEEMEDSREVGDSAIVGNKQNGKGTGKNSKLDPQVIPRSGFAKNGIEEEQEIIMVHDCNADHIGMSKEEDSEHLKSSNCETKDERKFVESEGQETHGKYSEDHETVEEPAVVGHFERTLWEKLIAGLKCSQRDCGEALKPTETIRGYMIEPSIRRARKHSVGRNSEEQS